MPGLFPSPDGTIEPAGLLRIPLGEWHLRDGALPDDWTLGADTADAGSAVSASTNRAGGIRLDTADVADSTVTIWGPEISLADMEGLTMELTVTGGVVDDNAFEFGFLGDDAGAYVRQANSGANDYAYIYLKNASTTTSIGGRTQFALRGPVTEIGHAFLRVRPDLNLITLSEGEQTIMAQRRYTAGAVGLSTVKPFIRVTAGADGVAAAMATEPDPIHVGFDIHQILVWMEWRT